MRVHVDISGQVSQRNLDSCLGCKRSDGLTKTVFLPKRSKKAVIRKYKGQVVNLIEKIHCILIYYCVRDILENVDELIICNDANYRRVRNLLPMLFKDSNEFERVNIKPLKEGKSNGHKPAVKAYRKRKYADKILTKDNIERRLFEFKK